MYRFPYMYYGLNLSENCVMITLLETSSWSGIKYQNRNMLKFHSERLAISMQKSTNRFLRDWPPYKHTEIHTPLHCYILVGVKCKWQLVGYLDQIVMNRCYCGVWQQSDHQPSHHLVDMAYNSFQYKLVSFFKTNITKKINYCKIVGKI